MRTCPAVCEVSVTAPVEVPMVIVLLLVSELPVQVRRPALLAVDRLIVPLVPNALFAPVFPSEATERNPFVKATPPLKLLAVFDRTRVEVPVLLEILPEPLMTPERLPVRLEANVTARLFVRIRSLVMLTAVLIVPVPDKAMLGPVTPLLRNSSAFPVMLKTGAVPEPGPVPLKVSLFSWNVPPMSLLESAVAPAACEPVKIRVVVDELAGAVPPPQFVPEAHWSVPDAGIV